MKMEPTVSSETWAIRIQTPGNYPKRNNLHLEHGESLRTILTLVHIGPPSPRFTWRFNPPLSDFMEEAYGTKSVCIRGNIHGLILKVCNVYTVRNLMHVTTHWISLMFVTSIWTVFWFGIREVFRVSWFRSLLFWRMTPRHWVTGQSLLCFIHFVVFTVNSRFSKLGSLGVSYFVGYLVG